MPDSVPFTENSSALGYIPVSVTLYAVPSNPPTTSLFASVTYAVESTRTFALFTVNLDDVTEFLILKEKLFAISPLRVLGEVVQIKNSPVSGLY